MNKYSHDDRSTIHDKNSCILNFDICSDNDALIGDGNVITILRYPTATESKILRNYVMHQGIILWKVFPTGPFEISFTMRAAMIFGRPTDFLERNCARYIIFWGIRMIVSLDKTPHRHKMGNVVPGGHSHHYDRWEAYVSHGNVLVWWCWREVKIIYCNR